MKLHCKVCKSCKLKWPIHHDLDSRNQLKMMEFINDPYSVVEIDDKSFNESFKNKTKF